MAIYSLTDGEIIEVRLNIGASLTAEDLSDDQINSESILGAAVDYVLEKVRENLDISRLTADNEITAATRLRDETAEDVANFINVVLKPPQQNQFRRAIVYRTAGVAAPLVKNVTAQNVGVLSERRAIPPVQLRQATLYQQADDEINLLRNAFPDDAFIDTSDVANNPRAKYTLFELSKA